jgi:hypothetical protein
MRLVVQRLGIFAFVISILSLTACGPKLIPNTPFEDTADNREILEILRKYKIAVETRDAKGVVALAAPSYLDARDSISYETLEKDLQKDFDRLKDIRLDIRVNRIQVDGSKAQVDYYYTTTYQFASADQTWKRFEDDKRMILNRDGGVWRVTSGL